MRLGEDSAWRLLNKTVQVLPHDGVSNYVGSSDISEYEIEFVQFRFKVTLHLTWPRSFPRELRRPSTTALMFDYCVWPILVLKIGREKMELLMR